MENKSLLITGADGALGRVVSAELMRNGWTLYASVINEKSKQTISELFPDDINKNIFPSIADLSDENDVKSFVSSAENISGLVHIAGGYKGGKPIEEHKTEDFDFLMNLNAKPTFLLLKYVLPVLKKNNAGAVVAIAAKPVLHPSPGNAAYAASKSVVASLILHAAEEGREFNISANCILPATIQTPSNLSWASKEEFAKFTPPSDIADMIAFLVSEKGKGITGTLIPMYNKIPS